MQSAEENRLLALLAKEWEFKGPPGIMDISDIVAALPVAPSATLAALKVLYRSGLIDMNALKTSAFLTPEGYAAADRSGNRKDEES
jgi:Mn-dependent DtxR family transcriptional regulator